MLDLAGARDRPGWKQDGLGAETLKPTSRMRAQNHLQLVPLVLACSLAATGAGTAGDPPRKTHTLFMGTDLSVVSQDKVLPVRDVEDNSFVVIGPAGRMVVRADDQKLRLKLEDALKLTSTCVTVEKLVFERVYSAGKDPMVKFQDAARTSAYMSAGVSNTDSEIRWAEASVGYARAGAASLPADVPPEARIPWQALLSSGESRLQGAEADSRMAQSLDQMQAVSPLANSVNMTSELADEQFDALNVTYELSSPRPLSKPYVVIVMRYLAQKDRPDTANVWVYAQRLPALDEHPRKFNVRRVGFPPGFHVDSYHVHLYDNGAEVATTASRKQVALTTDEAYEYAVIEYIGDNRDQTKAPLKARGFWPADLHSRLVPDKLTRNLYAKVDKDGHALGLFEDENCARPVADAEIAAVTPELRFLPALQKGRPVAGIALIKLGLKN